MSSDVTDVTSCILLLPHYSFMPSGPACVLNVYIIHSSKLTALG